MPTRRKDLLPRDRSRQRPPLQPRCSETSAGQGAGQSRLSPKDAAVTMAPRGGGRGRPLLTDPRLPPRPLDLASRP